MSARIAPLLVGLLAVACATARPASQASVAAAMERDGAEWRADVHSVQGRPLTRCVIRPGTLTCAP